MLTLMFRTVSSNFATALILIAVTTLGFFTDRALADSVIVSGTHSASDIKGKCGGGTFSADGEGYGCVTKKGSVSCNWDGKCIGECNSCGKGAAIAHKGDPILGVLSGTTLKAGTNTPAKTTATPIRVKTPVAHSGTDSTEHQGKKK
jgi:hypothetical protein